MHIDSLVMFTLLGFVPLMVFSFCVRDTRVKDTKREGPESPLFQLGHSNRQERNRYILDWWEQKFEDEVGAKPIRLAYEKNQRAIEAKRGIADKQVTLSVHEKKKAEIGGLLAELYAKDFADIETLLADSKRLRAEREKHINKAMGQLHTYKNVDLWLRSDASEIERRQRDLQQQYNELMRKEPHVPMPKFKEDWSI